MLEANTDRMWFTIGSVLVGAALITLAQNGLKGIGEQVLGDGTDGSGLVGEMLDNVTPPSN